MSLASYPIIAERPLQLSDAPANGLGQHSPQPVPHWQQYFSKSSNDLISRYANASSWSPSTMNWPQNTAPSTDFSSGPGLSALSGLATHGQYPESSQRTSLPSSPQTMPFSQQLSSERSASRLAPAPPKLSELWGSELYTIDDTESPRLPSRHGTSTPSVKQEPDDSDGGFIMEFSNPSSSPSAFDHTFAPPTEVPLRATQASKEMRKMMGVFRLNPFTMHNAGGRGAQIPSWNGEDAGPLDEEPQLYEFQLILDDADSSSDEELSSFSPDFEIRHGTVERDCSPQDEWAEYTPKRKTQSSSRRASIWDHSNAQIYTSPTGTSASLELEYPDSSTDQQPGAASFPFRYPLNAFAAQHEVSTPASSSYASSSSSSEIPHMPRRDSIPDQSWNDYLHHSRPSSSIGVSEPAARPNIPAVPSPSSTHYLQTGSALSISASRRWSLPSHSQAPFLL